LTIFLEDYPAFDLSVDGQAIRAAPARAGEFHLHDLSVGVLAGLHRPLDVLFFHIPRDVLNAVSEECGLPRLDGSPMIPGLGVPDAVLQDLGLSLLPSLRRMKHANRLFMDHIGTALLVHLARTYGNARAAPERSGGGLAPSQLRRVEEMMIARLDGDITLEALARECDMPRWDFVCAFAKVKGRPPHRWQLKGRIKKARDLLLNTDLELTEIAAVSDFTDRKHLGRVFVRATGIAPAEWRRLQRPSRKDHPQPSP
jgi:AraC-like DNA-binding protein